MLSPIFPDKMPLVAPSLLSADFLHLEKDVAFVNEHADLFHLDVMDGIFVPNLSFGFPVVEAVAARARKPLDVHLMIVHPERYIERFAAAGASMISFHLEAAEDAGIDPAVLLDKLHALGVRAGLAIDPDVPVKSLFPFIGKADFMLVMSVFAGFGGQKFIEETYDRIAALHEEIRRQNAPCQIEVDGGVSPANAAALARCGAGILVAGSSVFKAADRVKAVEQMRGQRM